MPDPRLHHTGFVVADIEKSLPRFLASMNARQTSEIFHDPIQKVKVVFLLPTDTSGVEIELVAPEGEGSPVAALASRGGGLHHLCYEVDSLEPHIESMRNRRALLVRAPQPAVAFGGRRIAWMITPERLLLEFVERTATE